MTADNMTLSSQIKQAAEKARASHETWLKCPDDTDDIQRHCAFLANDLLFKETCTFKAILSLIASHEARERKLVEALTAREHEELRLLRRIETLIIENNDLRRAAKAVKGEG